MPAYVIIEVRVFDPVLYEDYRHKLPPTMAAFGGTPLVRGFSELLEGDCAMDRMSIIEFPSRDAALSWYASPQVQALTEQRRASSEVIIRLMAAD